MAFKKGENPNHPKRGAAIKVEPIRSLKAVQKIKVLLLDLNQIRNYCLFTMGVNTAWRANELLSLKVGDVRYLGECDLITLKQSKNKKYRQTPINGETFKALVIWLDAYKPTRNDLPLFPSHKPGYTDKALSVPALSKLVKNWCDLAGLAGHFASHSMRKTWGYHQRVTFQAPTALLTRAFEHSSERQTLDYLGIQASEISDLYKNDI